MISSRAILFACLVGGLMAVPAFATKTHRTSAAGHAGTVHKAAGHVSSRSRSKTRAQARSHKLHGQQSIEPERVTQIQQALAHEHYLNQEPNGQWDAATQAAMQKYQSDQGWQTRLMPDSRALVKLGLGPDYSGAINARDIASAPSTAPSGAIPTNQVTGFAAASGVNR